MSEWLQVATSWQTVRRALAFAVVVGAILITINHFEAIVAGDIDRVRLLKMGLTLVVPYMVSTVSSVGATLESRRATDRKS